MYLIISVSESGPEDVWVLNTEDEEKAKRCFLDKLNEGQFADDQIEEGELFGGNGENEVRTFEGDGDVRAWWVLWKIDKKTHLLDCLV